LPFLSLGTAKTFCFSVRLIPFLELSCNSYFLSLGKERKGRKTAIKMSKKTYLNLLFGF